MTNPTSFNPAGSFFPAFLGPLPAGALCGKRKTPYEPQLPIDLTVADEPAPPPIDPEILRFELEFWNGSPKIEEILKTTPLCELKDPELLFLAGLYWYEKENRCDLAVSYFTASLTIQPWAAHILYFQIKAKISLAQFDAAEKDLGVLLFLDLSPPSLYIAAHLYCRKKDYKRAVDYLSGFSKPLLQASPHLVFLFNRLIEELEDAPSGENERLLEQLASLTEPNPEDFLSDSAAPSLIESASLRVNARKPSLRLSLQFWTRGGNVPLVRAFCTHPSFEGSLQRDPEMSQLLASFFLKEEDYENALLYANCALKLKPRSPLLLSQKIEALISLARYDEAHEALNFLLLITRAPAALYSAIFVYLAEKQYDSIYPYLAALPKNEIRQSPRFIALMTRLSNELLQRIAEKPEEAQHRQMLLTLVHSFLRP